MTSYISIPFQFILHFNIITIIKATQPINQFQQNQYNLQK